MGSPQLEVLALKKPVPKTWWTGNFTVTGTGPIIRNPSEWQAPPPEDPAAAALDAVSAALTPKADLDLLMGGEKSGKVLPETPEGTPGDYEHIIVTKGT